MSLRSIPPRTSTGPGQRLSSMDPVRFRTRGIGLANLSIFKAKSIPAKAQKKSRIINIRLVSGEDGLLKMYVD